MPVSGEKQAAGVGAQLDQPVVVQVNDAQGAPVAGALVRFTGAGGMSFQPDRDSQVPTASSPPTCLSAECVAIIGDSHDSHGNRKTGNVGLDEIALGYQEMLGSRISEIHCIRCHDPESTPERVSNHDNLDPPPHAFTDGAALNAISGDNLVAIITHGGAALNKSAAMPPYGNTLNKTEIDALAAYLRAVADPPYRPQGVFYAGN